MYTKEYLREKQYKTPDNLQSRISIHDRFSQSPVNIFKWIFEHYPIESGHKILEIGAGTGEFWKQNLSALPANVEVTLTDISEGMVETSKKSISGPRFVVADAESLPFENHSFDAVFAHFMLYHPASPTNAIGEAKRVLKPDGFLGAVTGSEVHLKEIFELTNHLLSKRGLPAFPRMGAPFWEQNAEQQLKTAFEKITVDSFSDWLRVTDANAVVDYVRSQYPAKSELAPDFFQEYKETVQREIDRNGFWKITKRTMLYVCR